MRVKAKTSARNGIPCGLDAAWVLKIGTKYIQSTWMFLSLDQLWVPVPRVEWLARTYHRPGKLQ